MYKTSNVMSGIILFDGAQVETGRVPVGDAPSLVDAWIMLGKDIDCGPLTYRTWVVLGVPDFDASEYTGPRCGTTLFNPISTIETLTSDRWLMQGRDVDCGPLTYRTWVVQGSPDFTGSEYTGARCGATPFADVSAIAIHS